MFCVALIHAWPLTHISILDNGPFLIIGWAVSFLHIHTTLVGTAKVSKPVCSLYSLNLNNGSILAPQLHFLTMSSYSSLRRVELSEITGLTNTDLRIWLSEIAPTLEFFTLLGSFFPRKSPDEGHAVDVTIRMMCNLRYIDLEGDVVTALVIEQKPRGVGNSSIYIDNAPSISGQGLIRALGHTGFRAVELNGIPVFLDGKTQGEEVIWNAVLAAHLTDRT